MKLPGTLALKHRELQKRIDEIEDLKKILGERDLAVLEERKQFLKVSAENDELKSILKH